MLWFDALMGTTAYGTSGGTTTGANPYDHIWFDESPRDFHNSLTLELIEGNTPDGKCQTVNGAKVIGGTVGFEAAGFVTAKFDIIGKQKTTNQTPTPALTANAPIHVLSSHLSTATDGSGDSASDIIIRSWEWTFTNGLDASREVAGSAFIGEPIRNKKNESRIKMRKEFRTITLLDDYIAQTDNVLAFRFTSGVNDEFFVEFPAARIVNFESGVDSAGICFAEVEYEAMFFDTSTDHSVKLTIGNQQSTITT